MIRVSLFTNLRRQIVFLSINYHKLQTFWFYINDPCTCFNDTFKNFVSRYIVELIEFINRFINSFFFNYKVKKNLKKCQKIR